MPFPDHIEHVLSHFGVRADTKAALYDLYIAMGAGVLEVFADLTEGTGSPADLQPEDTLTIRQQVVERFLQKNHPRWVAGMPTASLWHPREAEGRASGAAVPLGELPPEARRLIEEGQPLPDGLLVLGRNAHYGGRSDTISFDVIARDLSDALSIGKAAGQQHTLPGSVGETSGTFDSGQGVALIWEVQPNVYKPAGERNREIARLYRRHRNWHLVTLASALVWLRHQKAATFILRGSALAVTHEVNPEKPVSAIIAGMHDRTVEQVAGSLGITLADPTAEDERLMLDSTAMNHALRKHVLVNGAVGAIWKAMER